MIPVFGIPILNKVDLFQRMLNTVDLRIERLYVIDNGGVIKHDQIDWPWDVGSIHISTPGYNMGVAQSWNQIVRANIDAPWWLFVNNDLTLEPGALQRLAEDMDAHAGTPYLSMVEMGNENWGNHFGCHALNAEAIDLVGWFDENLHPIYFEDTDWKMRAERLGLETHLIRSSTHHDGNESWKGNPPLAEANARSWKGNVEYFDNKWNDPESFDLRYWRQPSVERLRKQSWSLPAVNNVKA